MSEWCREYRVEAWAYCLMPNHVHLILVPETKDGLNLAVGKAHKRYTRRINFREGWSGHLWQGRFASFVTRKITRTLARIALGLQDCLFLGNLDARRDWGHAKDFVRMQWMMLQQAPPGELWALPSGGYWKGGDSRAVNALANGNRALRAGRFADAIDYYRQPLEHQPELIVIVDTCSGYKCRC